MSQNIPFKYFLACLPNSFSKLIRYAQPFFNPEMTSREKKNSRKRCKNLKDLDRNLAQMTKLKSFFILTAF